MKQAIKCKEETKVMREETRNGARIETKQMGEERGDETGEEMR